MIPNTRATPSWFGVEVSLPFEVDVVVVVVEDSVLVGLELVVAPVVLKLVGEADVSPLFESSGGEYNFKVMGSSSSMFLDESCRIQLSSKGTS